MRYKFWSYKRPDDQQFLDYLTALQRLASSCEFQEKDNMIRDKVIFSMSDSELVEKLLELEDPKLQDIVDKCVAAETTRTEMKVMTNKTATADQDKSIDYMRRSGNKSWQQAKSTDEQSAASDRQENFDQQTVKRRKTCRKCGTRHAYGRCPAFGEKCLRCHKMNHFASQCRSKSVSALQQAESSSDEFFMDALTSDASTNDAKTSVPARQWYEKVKVCGSHIKMKVDTGAETNTVPWKTWKKIVGRPELEKCDTKLRGLDGSIITHLGKATVPVQIGSSKVVHEIFVTTEKTTPILGLQAAEKLQIISKGANAQPIYVHSVTDNERLTLDKVTKSYKQVFHGLGKFPGQHKIRLKDNACPVIQAPRRIPHHLLEPLKATLQEMCSDGVIESVNYPTDWVHNLVVVEKKDSSLRLCLDPKFLNENIRREHYQMPTFEEEKASLCGPQFFTILDMKSAFWHIELDDESADLCTFHSPLVDTASVVFHSVYAVPVKFCKEKTMRCSEISSMFTLCMMTF
jgi:hypothetical protein